MIFQVRPVVSWYQIYLIHVFNCCLRQSSQAPTCSLHLPSNRGQSKLIMKLKAPLLVWFYQKRLSFCQPLSCLYWMRKFFKSINIVNFCLFCQLCMRCTAACSGYRSWSDKSSSDSKNILDLFWHERDVYGVIFFEAPSDVHRRVWVGIKLAAEGTPSYLKMYRVKIVTRERKMASLWNTNGVQLIHMNACHIWYLNPIIFKTNFWKI